MSIGYYYRKLDFLGHNIGFEYENTNKYSTNSGAFFSLITLILAIILSIMFGREVYERKNPFISTNKENLENSKIFVLFLKMKHNLKMLMITLTFIFF